MLSPSLKVATASSMSLLARRPSPFVFAAETLLVGAVLLLSACAGLGSGVRYRDRVFQTETRRGFELVPGEVARRGSAFAIEDVYKRQLLEQPFASDPRQTIGEALADFQGRVMERVEVVGFARFDARDAGA